MSSVFPQLLCISCVMSGLCYSQDPPFMSIVVCTHTLCIFNLVWSNRLLQLCMHDVFVYSILYANLVSQNNVIRVYGCILGVCMCATRMWYERCIFLYWHTSRNIDFDVWVWLVIAGNLSGLNVPLTQCGCAVIAVASHFFRDEKEDSIIEKLREYSRSDVG